MTAPASGPFEQAVQAALAGRLDEAESALAALLIRLPDHAEALQLLGKIQLQKGAPRRALELLERARGVHPGLAEIDFEIGVVRLACEDWEGAAKDFRRHLERHPKATAARYNLAWAERKRGRPDRAVPLLREVVAAEPGHAAAWFNLGNALVDAGQPGEAVTALRKARELAPDDANVLTNLGAALLRLGQARQAEEVLGRAVRLAPKAAAAWHALVRCLRAQGRVEEAAAAYLDAVRQAPSDPDLAAAAAETLLAAGRDGDAERLLDALEPRLPKAAALSLARGRIHMRRQDVAAARRLFEKTVELDPTLVEGWNNLGKALSMLGEEAAALDAFQHAHGLAPDNAMVHSNLLFALLHSGRHDRAEVFAAHRSFGERHEAAVPAADWRSPPDEDPERRLRIGYVSPDFCEHATAFFLEPVLANHDRREVEVFCYYTRERVDAVTRRLRRHADHWRDIAGLEPDAAADLVRRDGIDILVDVAGHTANNALLVFARKPAPIQATWLGYPGTTGMRRIDYRIDSFPGEALTRETAFHSEVLVHQSRVAGFQPPPDAPEVVPPPALARGHVTFGSLNKPMKVHDRVRETWARILREVPDSRLLTVAADGDLPDVRRAVREQYRRLGVEPDRIEVVAFRPLGDFLGLFQEIDLLLDPFPYGGGTTTLLSLWMGVPVVQIGPQRAGMLGDGFISAADADDYVAKAKAAAAGLDRLADLRARLRPAMLVHHAMRGKEAAMTMEASFRAMWWRWLTPAETEKQETDAASCRSLVSQPAPPQPRILRSPAKSGGGGAVPGLAGMSEQAFRARHLVAMAQANIVVGRREAAREALVNAVALAPDDDVALRLTAWLRALPEEEEEEATLPPALCPAWIPARLPSPQPRGLRVAACLGLARGLLARGRCAAALAPLRAAHDLAPAHPDILSLLSQTLVALDRWEDAGKAYLNALAHAGATPLGWMHIPLPDATRRDWLAAIAARFPDAAPPALAALTAELHLAAGELTAAREHIAAACRGDGRLPLRLAHSILLRAEGALDQARALQGELLQAADLPRVRIQLALTLLALGACDEGRAILAPLLRKQPPPVPLAIEALLSLKAGRPEDALRTARDIPTPCHPWCMSAKALVELSCGETERALDLSSAAAGPATAGSWEWNNHALALRAAARNDEAAEAEREAARRTGWSIRIERWYRSKESAMQ